MAERAALYKRVLRGGAAAVLHHYPLLRGAGKLSRTLRLHRLFEPDERVWTTLRDGSRLQVHGSDYTGLPIYCSGDYDRRISEVLRRVLEPGDHVWDIGANYGVYTMQAASLVGADGMVHAVEPQPDLAAMLGESAAANDYTQVRVHAVAVSDRAGSLELIRTPTDRGSGQSNRGGVRVAATPAAAACSVAVEHAGELLGRFAHSRTTLMKIDVENHEAVVLGAAADELRRRPIPIILFESHPRPGALSDRPVAALLLDLGYRLHVIDPTWRRLRIRPWRTGDAEPHASDYLAIHPAADAARATRLLQANPDG